MAKLMLMLFMAGAFSGVARAEVTWNGSSALRTLTQIYNDGQDTKDTVGNDKSKQTKKRWELQASFGGFGKSDFVDWGVEMRLQPAGVPNSTWLPFQEDKDLIPTMSQAYGRLHGKVWESDWSVTVGRQKPVFVFDTIGQSLFGNPVRWDGFGWTLKHGMFGFNMAQYVQGAASGGKFGTSTYAMTDSSQSIANKQSHFAVLYAFQPTVTFNINDDIKSLFAVGYYDYDGTDASTTSGYFTNALHGGGLISTPTGTTPNTNPLIMDNPRQWQLLSDTSLPWNFRFIAEYIKNKSVNYGTRANVIVVNPVAADNTAWALDLAYGTLKKAGDWTLSYAYTNKGIASVITSYTNIDIGADNISHMFVGNYMVEDHLWLTGKVEFHKEKAGLDGAGQPDSPLLEKQTRLEFYASVAY